jgi:hypothetical protein
VNAETPAAVLRSSLDLRVTLERVRSDGAAFVERALGDAFLGELRRETAALPFEPLAEVQGSVRQEGEIHVVEGRRAPAIERLRTALVERIRRDGAGIAGCDVWRPNEVSIQRYRAAGAGITPHLDPRRYRLLVAIITAEGAAPFALHATRDGDPLVTWSASEGSLVLLRAPGLDGVGDGRPLHAVGGPREGRRVSVSYRMQGGPTC